MMVSITFDWTSLGWKLEFVLMCSESLSGLVQCNAVWYLESQYKSWWSLSLKVLVWWIATYCTTQTRQCVDFPFCTIAHSSNLGPTPWVCEPVFSVWLWQSGHRHIYLYIYTHNVHHCHNHLIIFMRSSKTFRIPPSPYLEQHVSCVKLLLWVRP